MGFLDRFFNTDKKVLEEVRKQIEPALALADEYKKLSDQELKDKTNLFRQRLNNGETLDDILPEAFATAREAAGRVIHEYPYEVQMIGACVLHRGDIAEMKTGEGKTLTAVMAVYLNALSSKGVHVITVNDYLAKRDSKWMGQIYEFLGLTVGLNLRELTPAQKKQAYLCDITYTTNSELGFDYLRDNMVTRVEDRVLRPLNYALVDEVDSILIDESRTPLIISAGAKAGANTYINADKFAKRIQQEDYVIDVKGKHIQLSEEGVFKAEKFFGINNLYSSDNTSLVHYIAQALHANYIMHNDVDYVVEDGEVIIVDQNTGRKMPGREFSDGLHQAIQAKEGVTIKQETITFATITYQNFFRLYNKLSGMTGTAKTEEEEFLEIYNMRVVEIPTNKPVARIDENDVVFGTKKAKYEQLIEDIKQIHATGQPILVGTISVETSELVHKLLEKARIRHEVLNAKNHAREADIIAQAGKKGAVTIATNMAGRGTDIKLGGTFLDEEGNYIIDPIKAQEVKDLGGLAILGSERHDSRRIDNQLRGRAGRQGDPGFSRFYVSMQDELMLRFGDDKQRQFFVDTIGDAKIEVGFVSKVISSAQKRVEGMSFDIRKTLLDYDNVMAQQRQTMYEQRNFILEHEDIHSIVKNMFDKVYKDIVESNCQSDKKKPTYDIDAITSACKGLNSDIDCTDLDGKSLIDASTLLSNRAFEAYDKKIKPVKEKVLEHEKLVTLRVMDRAWVSQIDVMTKLKEGIGLRSYAQNKPLQVYVEEGYQLFEEMMFTIAKDVVLFANNVEVVNN